MKKFAWIAGIIVVLVAVVAGALFMSDLFVSGEWRYRITIAVETPEGVKTGSAVREVSTATRLIRWPEGGADVDVKGEAVVVDLGDRGLLFGLIDWNSYDELYSAFPYPEGGGQATVDGIRYYNSLEPGRSALLTNPKYWPQLVMFADLDDPMSVQLVHGSRFNPETQMNEPVNALEDLFGDGVTLKSIAVEITNEPVTWGVVDKALSDNFWSTFREWMKSMNIRERAEYTYLFSFKEGEPK